MPIVRVDVTGPKSHAYKASVMRGVRKAIVSHLNAPDERVSIRVCETEAESVDAPGWRSDRFTVVEVWLYSGRTTEAKAACVDTLRQELSVDPGIPAHDVSVIFSDRSPEDLHVLQREDMK